VQGPSDFFRDLPAFLQSQGADIPLTGFLANMALAALCAYLLGRLYVHCGHSLSNRSHFAANFVPFTLTTMLVISVVKSSLALSLGMVGALSIIRFRAAIKEPEELNYLFLALAIGLGFGANQWHATILAFLVIAAILVIRRRAHPQAAHQNLYLTVSSRQPGKVGLPELTGVLSKHTAAAAVTRFDETADAVEASFLVEFDGIEQLHSAQQALRSLGDSVTISFVEAKGVL
jgi:hypothetical protein